MELVLPKEPMRAYSREYNQDAGLVKSVELVLPKEPRSKLSEVNVTCSGKLSTSSRIRDVGLVTSVELVLAGLVK